MTKVKWNESMNMFRDHVDPEKEEQRKQMITGNTCIKNIDPQNVAGYMLAGYDHGFFFFFYNFVRRYGC